jgi:hypothetical protein
MTQIAIHRVRRRAEQRPAVRYTLGSLLAFGALCAFGGGYYGLAGAEGVPREWLEGTPFKDYFVPSLILLVVVGGTYLAAAGAVLVRSGFARLAGFGAGFVMLIWIAVELLMIGYVSWMQPATTAGALAVLVLAWLLPRRTADGERLDWRGRGIGYAWFAAMVAGWITFYFLLAASEATLGDLAGRIRELPLVLELLVWLVFFPYVLALAVWTGGWPDVLRLVLVTACAVGWSLMFYPWRKAEAASE